MKVKFSSSLWLNLHFHQLIFGPVLLSLFLWTGCSTVQYRVGDQTFGSREKALERIDQQLSDFLASIPPTKTPVHGTAIVVYPTIDQIKQKGVKSTGNWASVSKGQATEMIDYTAVTLAKNYEFMGKAVERRQIFDKVSLVQDAAPEAVKADNCDFLIYYQLVNPEVGQWYLKTKTLTEPKPLLFETGKAMGAPRTIAWLDNLETIAGQVKPNDGTDCLGIVLWL